MANFLKIPDVALAANLDAIRQLVMGAGVGSDLTVGLFTTNHTPVAGDVLATYAAIEATFAGYARQSIDRTVWTTPVVVGSKAITLNTPKVFVASALIAGAETVYGYFVRQIASGELAWAQLFDSPVIVTLPGDAVVFTPQFTFASEH